MKILDAPSPITAPTAHRRPGKVSAVRSALAAVREVGLARLFNTKHAAKLRPVDRYAGVVRHGRHAADHLIYQRDCNRI